MRRHRASDGEDDPTADVPIVPRGLLGAEYKPVQTGDDRLTGVIRFLDAGGLEAAVPLAAAGQLPIEDGKAARRIKGYRNIGHTPGWHWSPGTATLVRYESYLESQWMRTLDFDPHVAKYASQPFHVIGSDAAGDFELFPDLFVRMRDGTGHVIDVKHPQLAGSDKDVRNQRRTAQCCAQAGWTYWRVGDIDAQFTRNIKWLAVHRRPPAWDYERVAEQIRTLAREPTPIGDVLSSLTAPELGRAVLFHLCWNQDLLIDVSQPLRDSSRIVARAAHDPWTRWYDAPAGTGVSRRPDPHQGVVMDAPLRLSVDSVIEFEKDVHQVIGLSGSYARLLSTSGTIQSIAITQLVSDPSFVPTDQQPVPQPREPADMAALVDHLPPDEVERALSLERHLREVRTGYRSGKPTEAEPDEPRPQYDLRRSLNDRVTTKAEEIGVHVRTLYTQLRKYEDGNNSWWALLDQRRLRQRDPLAGVDDRVIEAIKLQYQAEIHDSSGTINHRFLRRVVQRIRAAPDGADVPIPSQRTLYRAVEHLLPLSPNGSTPRRRNDANRPARRLRTVTADQPGEVVMIDTTPLDVIAYDPDHDRTHRVELTYAMDLATRSILAWRLTPAGTKGIDISQLLADMMTPMTMRMGWSESLKLSMLRLPHNRLLDLDQRLAEAAARPIIYPSSLLIDLGKPYQSRVLHGGCQWHRIDIQDARNARPLDKPQIERGFRTIREQFSDHLAGATGRNVDHRGTNPEAFARWTLEEIEDFFAEYIVAIYQKTQQQGLRLPGYPQQRLSPNQAYELSVATTGYVMCPVNGAMYYELLPFERRLTQHYGVELNTLVYDGDGLDGCRVESTDSDGKWVIHYDERDLTFAYFLNPHDQQWHLLTWRYARDDMLPFTDAMVRAARRLLTQRGQDNRKQELIAQALVELQNRTDAPEMWLRVDHRAQLKDSQRAQAAARDRHNATRPAGHPEPRTPLYPVPGPADPDDDFDPDDVQALPAWKPVTDEGELP